MGNNNLYTKELQSIITYMKDILVNEFPTDAFTPEHLIVSMLDNSNTHAYMMLDNCLMTENLKQLREIYISFLRNHCSQNPNKDADYNIELKKIIENADNECRKYSSRLVGSEHILLSMLSEDTDIIRIQEAFKNAGIDYNFIKNKCTEVNKQKIVPNKMKNNPMNPNLILPLKSEINTKAMSNKNNYINQYTINITKQAREGKIDDLIGREEELQEVIRTMARRKKNNVILVGKGGVGKTEIVNGLALAIINNKVPEFLFNKEIVKLNIMALVSGTHFRGMFEERVNGLFNELKEAKNYILFIDDMQTVLKTGTKDKDTDLSSMISDILNENEVQVVGAINFKDYKNAIESNTSISRKLQKIVIEPSSIEETNNIIISNKKYYEDYHNVSYTDNAIKTCVDLAYRYITDRSLPDSAIDVLDLCGANTCFLQREPDDVIFAKNRLLEINKERTKYLNEGDFEFVDKLTQEENSLKLMIANYNREYKINRIEINENDVANIVSHITKIPVSKLNSNEKKKIANIENVLKETIIGQDDAIESVSKIIKRNRIGLGDNTKCMGALLLVGPTGTGKTLLAKKLAEEVFGDENALIRFDMSEYSEKSSVSKLIGASSGYIGYENGGQLTEAIKNKPYCVLLLDELEKSDGEVQNMFLQVLDDGRITDNSGQVVNFKNVIILMTSNIGAQKANQFGGGIGFKNDTENNRKSIIEKEIKKKFTPEFINRIDKIVHFNSLTDDNLEKIIELELETFRKRLENINYKVTWDNEAVNVLFKNTINEKEFGARPIKRIIQNEIEDDITNLILLNDYEKNHEFKITAENNKIKIA